MSGNFPQGSTIDGVVPPKYGALSKPLHVVSELALPFMEMSQYNSCVVVDEAIYHGTTFSKVCL